MSGTWWRLINKRAAHRERFPTLAAVLKERPGSQTDRARQEHWQAQNRQAVAAAAQNRKDRERADIEDADRFIAEMKRRQHQRFVDQLREREERG